jgi:hypothetical protein
LYIAVGDGGAADDQGDGHVTGGNDQSKSDILGMVLRIDVDTSAKPASTIAGKFVVALLIELENLWDSYLFAPRRDGD